MPKVNFVKKARKSYPQFGIKKGDSYYHWSFAFGPTIKSKKRPRPSQLTRSEFMSQALALQERIEDYSTPDEMSVLEEWRDELVSDIESLADETQEKFDNMPDQLQYSETGQLLEERVEAMNNWKEEIEQVDCEEIDEDQLREDAKDELELNDGEEPTEEEIEERFKEMKQEKIEEVLDEIKNCDVDLP